MRAPTWIGRGILHPASCILYPAGRVGKSATRGGCRPDSVPRRAAFIHLGQAFPPGSCSLPGGLVRRGGRRGRATLDPPIRPCSAWGLPCPLRYRKGGALLPHPFTLTSGRIRRRSALCGTFPRVAAAGRYPACCPPGVRTFLCPNGTANARLLQSRCQYTAFCGHCHWWGSSGWFRRPADLVLLGPHSTFSGSGMVSLWSGPSHP